VRLPTTPLAVTPGASQSSNLGQQLSYYFVPMLSPDYGIPAEFLLAPKGSSCVIGGFGGALGAEFVTMKFGTQVPGGQSQVAVDLRPGSISEHATATCAYFTAAGLPQAVSQNDCTTFSPDPLSPQVNVARLTDQAVAVSVPPNVSDTVAGISPPPNAPTWDVIRSDAASASCVLSGTESTTATDFCFAVLAANLAEVSHSQATFGGANPVLDPGFSSTQWTGLLGNAPFFSQVPRAWTQTNLGPV
jgi:hypothetical protein